MPSIVSKTIMWIVWLILVLLALLMARFNTVDVSRLNTFARPLGVFVPGLFLIPIVLCGSLRFWLARIRHPWLALLPFLLGVFFAWQAGLYGLFLVPEFCVVFQFLSVVLFLLYLPVFVLLQRSPPKLGTTVA